VAAERPRQESGIWSKRSQDYGQAYRGEKKDKKSVDLPNGMRYIAEIMGITPQLMIAKNPYHALRSAVNITVEYFDRMSKFVTHNISYVYKKTVISGILLACVEYCPDVMAAPIWSGIVVHHSDSPAWTHASHIDRWHRERGWQCIGYNFVICTDGTIEYGRDLDRPGAHARGRNATHIGICLIGYDDFTDEQLASLRRLIISLAADHPIRIIERHHEQCPGAGVDVEGLARLLKPGL